MFAASHTLEWSDSEVLLDDDQEQVTSHSLTDDEESESIWDDFGLAEIASGEAEQRKMLLGRLSDLTLSSLRAYQEILEFAGDRELQSFAAVVLHQRWAHYHDLLSSQTQLWGESKSTGEERIVIRSLWRLAIWNLEQDRLSEFFAYAERAEALLEEAFLAAAAAIPDEAWEQLMQAHAVTICGARDRLDELANEISVTRSRV